MVSFRLRKVFYSAAIGAEQILLERKKEISKIDELEKQVVLAKKIMNSIQEKGQVDSATLIRAEGKIRKLEHKLKAQRYKVSAL